MRVETEGAGRHGWLRAYSTLACVLASALMVSGCASRWHVAARRRFAADHACPSAGARVSGTPSSFTVFGCGQHEDYQMVGGTAVPLAQRVRERFMLDAQCFTEISVARLGAGAWLVTGCGHVASYSQGRTGPRLLSHRAAAAADDATDRSVDDSAIFVAP